MKVVDGMAVSATTEAALAQADKLLDFSAKLDVDLLDQVVHCMNTQTGKFYWLFDKFLDRN